MRNYSQIDTYFSQGLLKYNVIGKYLSFAFLIFLCVALTFSQASAKNYGTINGLQILYVNSPSIHEGATLYDAPDETSRAIERYPNGTMLLLLDSQSDEWANVEVHGPNEIRGYMKISEVTPVDGSYGHYPLDENCMLIWDNYTFASSMPSDIQAAFSDSEWAGYHSVLGGIASQGCNIAAVIMKKEATNLLCLLENDGNGWVIDQICKDALYAGNELPKQLGFSLAAGRLYVIYPPSKEGYSETYEFVLYTSDSGYYLDRYVYGADEEHRTEANKGNVVVVSVDYQDGSIQIIREINSVTTKGSTPTTEKSISIQNFNIMDFADIIYEGKEKPF